jgi:secondary thiamine-phosphate synthase enzyme
MIDTTTLEIYPGAGFAVQNITDMVTEFVSSTEVTVGHLIVYFKHTTGSVIIGEHESGVVADLGEVLEALTPVDGTYFHHLREVDFNGYAHIRAALMPTSVIIPIEDGQLVLGTHQEIQIVDSQPEELPRYVYLQVSGE